MLGRVVDGRFVLVSRTSSGGAGTVFRATDRHTGTDVALKLIKAHDPAELERVAREAAMLATIDHPRVVRYLAHGVASGHEHYLAQEWIDGPTLAAFLSSQGCSASDVVNLGVALAEALAVAHAVGVVHRDVKPTNVLLPGGDPAQAKLVDFGVARASDGSGRLTQTGVAVGTPGYMSPEQARGDRAITRASDVWGLGCVLFEALTGGPAYRGSSATAIRIKVVVGDPPALVPLGDELPPSLCDLVRHMLQKKPLARPADGTAVLTALRALPAVAPGVRRKAGVGLAADFQLETAFTGEHDPHATRCYVLFSPPGELGPDVPDHAAALLNVSEAHDLELHLLDGCALLETRQHGRAAAFAAVRAALSLRESVDRAALAVVAQGNDQGFAEAIDRASAALERNALSEMFQDVVASVRGIPVDATVALLVAADFNIVETDDCLLLSARAAGP